MLSHAHFLLSANWTFFGWSSFWCMKELLWCLLLWLVKLQSTRPLTTLNHHHIDISQWSHWLNTCALMSVAQTALALHWSRFGCSTCVFLSMWIDSRWIHEIARHVYVCLKGLVNLCEFHCSVCCTSHCDVFNVISFASQHKRTIVAFIEHGSLILIASIVSNLTATLQTRDSLTTWHTRRSIVNIFDLA